ncbi:hypothetical protein PHMEG_00033716 [Phytophthora megakarya]|uniref:Retrotransposon gag domain-containing protein n=1 Tax=Phytophthora megakarya TaxID=4795 RepID=A0A225UU82_9STRA|nr:hypothetical protein PHMEG_00033716 [Phytophthora megakarya]
MSTSQVAEDTVSLLMAMGMEAHAYPSSTALADWTTSEAGTEMQRKDVSAGRQPVARSAGERVNPVNIPLPRTPKKTATAVFGSADQSPYFHDSPMVTPRANGIDGEHSTWHWKKLSRLQAPTDDSSSDEGNPFYQDDDENDAATELAWQIWELTAMEEMDPTPRFEIVQHWPLVKITPFRGKLDESENFMQWLRGFVYEMKGTHTSQRMVHGLPTEAQRWGRSLAQSSISKDESDKFISCYCSQFSQSTSARYYRAKRSEREHICDYLNRLNDYVRSAYIKFEHSGREAKEHLKHFLETCGDRDLERHLTPTQLRDIQTFEDIVSDIQKVEKRVPNRSSSQRSSRRDDKRHSSSSGKYGRHDSRSHSQEISRSEPRHTSRVELIDASVTDLITELQTRASSERPNEYSNDDPIDFLLG